MEKILMDLSKDIRIILTQKLGSKKIREKKTNITDGLILKMLCSQKDITQSDATATINMYSNRSLHRSSYVNRSNNMGIQVYEKIDNEITKILNGYNDENIIKQVFAVDGTYSILNKDLAKDNFMLNTSGKTISALICGVYNISYNYPVTLNIVTHRDERKSFIDAFSEKNLPKNSVYVFDRGYYSFNFISQLNEMEADFICRIKEGLSYIDHDNDDYERTIINKGHKIDVRIIKYTYDNNEYYIATNLFDKNEYSIETIKQLYHKRWNIEEFFKYVKSTSKIDNIKDNDIKEIQKTTYATLIISKLVGIIANHYEKDNPNMKINRNLLTRGIYKYFLMPFLYGENFDETFIKNFLKNHIIMQKIRNGRHYERTCFTPHKKWYNLVRRVRRYKRIAEAKKIKSINKKIYNDKIIKSEMHDKIIE